MGITFLKSSVLATAVGSLLVFAAFAANSVTQTQPDAVAKKGDRLELPMKVACGAGCTNVDDRIAQAFDTFVETDRDAGITTLTRIAR